MKDTDRKNIESITIAGEIYTLDYFKENGKKGGKKRWEGLSKKQIQDEMKKVRKAKSPDLIDIVPPTV